MSADIIFTKMVYEPVIIEEKIFLLLQETSIQRLHSTFSNYLVKTSQDENVHLSGKIPQMKYKFALQPAAISTALLCAVQE